MIKGMGIDMVAVNRIRETEARWGRRFLRRVFTEGEIEYSFKHKSPHIHLAARFAAKEAMMKALGTGHSRGIVWRDIEVINSANGRPGFIPHGKTKELIESMGVNNIHMSITHDGEYAIAQVVLEGNSNEPLPHKGTQNSLAAKGRAARVRGDFRVNPHAPPGHKGA